MFNKNVKILKNNEPIIQQIKPTKNKQQQQQKS